MEPQHLPEPQPQPLPEWFGGVWIKGKKVTDWRKSPQQKGTRKVAIHEVFPSLRLPQLHSHSQCADSSPGVSPGGIRQDHDLKIGPLIAELSRLELSFESLTSTEPAEYEVDDAKNCKGEADDEENGQRAHGDNKSQSITRGGG